MRTVSGARACKNGCNLVITDYLVWWRRGESEYSGLLKTLNLLICRDAKNAEHGEIAPNWNVSGTRDFRDPRQPLCPILVDVSACAEVGNGSGFAVSGRRKCRPLATVENRYCQRAESAQKCSAVPAISLKSHRATSPSLRRAPPAT